MSTGAEKRYSAEEYLAFERQSETKHEYFDGEVFAMAGGTQPHSAIAGNLIGELRNETKERGCHVHTGDMRVLCPTGLYTYPDVSVVCGELDLEDENKDTLLNPLVIVEVLSKSTDAYDRGRKFANYKTIESLKEYVLVAQDGVAIDHFARQKDGSWQQTTVTDPSASLNLPALECSIAVEEVYRNVKFK
jgi:Uma2 family endonuclease